MHWTVWPDIIKDHRHGKLRVPLIVIVTTRYCKYLLAVNDSYKDQINGMNQLPYTNICCSKLINRSNIDIYRFPFPVKFWSSFSLTFRKLVNCLEHYPAIWLRERKQRTNITQRDEFWRHILSENKPLPFFVLTLPPFVINTSYSSAKSLFIIID